MNLIGYNLSYSSFKIQLWRKTKFGEEEQHARLGEEESEGERKWNLIFIGFPFFQSQNYNFNLAFDLNSLHVPLLGFQVA